MASDEHAGLSDIPRQSDEVARYYDDWADQYDDTLSSWAYDAPAQAATILAEMTGNEAHVLDAGCGTGLSGRALADKGFGSITGIDVSARSVEAARETGVYQSTQLLNMQNLPFPFTDGAFDALVCVGVLTYLPDSGAILEEFSRLVAEGGPVVLTQRTDLYVERDFETVLDRLADESIVTDLRISEPKPYLPDNPEFADNLLVRYVSFRSGRAGR